MSEEIKYDRRRFLGTAAMTIAAAQLGMIDSAKAQSSEMKSVNLPTIKPGTSTSFGSLEQIDADLLNVGYAEAGPVGGPAVILLHGWPYDIHSFVDVAPLLAEARYRVIVPFLRGYSTTRFLSSETLRNGQPDDATFERSAASFDNPDHVQIVIHNYRWRLGLAEGEAKHDELEKRLAAAPVIAVPTITLEGDANGAPHPDSSSYAKKFSGKYAHRVIKGGIGHNLPQEAPQDFARAVVEVDSY